MTGCRIGKVTPKGNIRMLAMPTNKPCTNILRDVRELIDENTLCVAVTVIQKNRKVLAGCSYEPGFAPCDLKGMMAESEQILDRLVFDVPETPKGA